MSLFGIHRWHIETSLDMMMEGDSPKKIEEATRKKTRENLEDIKKWVEKELFEKKYSTKEYENLLNKWLETYRTKIQKDTQEQVAGIKDDLKGDNLKKGKDNSTNEKSNNAIKPENEKQSNEKTTDVSIKTGEEKNSLPNNNQGEVTTQAIDNMPPSPPKNVTSPNLINSYENFKTKPTQKEIYDLYNIFLDTAKSIDSFGDLKTKKEKQDSKIVLISNYNNLILKINELLTSGKATKSDIDYSNKIKMLVANYFAGNLKVDNTHWKDYEISSQIAISMLSSVKTPPERPNFLKVLSRLKGTGVSSYIAQELVNGTSQKTIFENKLVKDKLESESKELSKQYEVDLKKYLDGLEKNTLTNEQKAAIRLLREVEGTDGWKKSTWDAIKLGGIDLGVIGAGIGTGAIAGGEVGSIGFIPGAVVGTVVGGIVGGTVTTLGMMVNHGDNYFMEHWSVGGKELGINIATFGAGGAVIKTGNWALGIVENGTKLVRYSTLAGVTVLESATDVSIGALSDILRNDGNISVADAYKNNLIWALIPLFTRGISFSKIRKDLANKTIDSINRERQLTSLGREDLAKQVKQRTNTEINAVRNTEEVAEKAKIVEKTKGNLAQVESDNLDSVLGLLKYEGNSLEGLKAYNNGIGLKYAEELQGIIRQEGGKEKLSDLVANIRRSYDQEVNRLGITESVGKQNAWIYWDIGKQLHLNKNPGTPNANYHLGDPFSDKKVVQDIVDRHLGWEIAQKEGLDLKHSYEYTNLGRERRESIGKTSVEGSGNTNVENYSGELSFFQKHRANELIFKELDNGKKVNIGGEEYTKLTTTKGKVFYKDSKGNEITKGELKSKISTEDQKNVLIDNSKSALKEIKNGTKGELGEINIDSNTKVRSDGTVMIKNGKNFRIATKEESDNILNNPKFSEKILKKTFPTFSSDVLTIREEILKKLGDNFPGKFDKFMRDYTKKHSILGKFYDLPSSTVKIAGKSALKPLDIFSFVNSITKGKPGEGVKLLLSGNKNTSWGGVVKDGSILLGFSVIGGFLGDTDLERDTIPGLAPDGRSDIGVLSSFLIGTTDTAISYAELVFAGAFWTIIDEYYGLSPWNKGLKSSNTSDE
nr:hypothetical protein [Candidatus Gracilibacteria bacterium]